MSHDRLNRILGVVLVSVAASLVHGDRSSAAEATDLSRVTPAEAPLADAAEAERWRRVDELLSDGAEVNAAQGDGMTALHWAAYHDHAPAVERLLAAGADANLPTRYRVTPLAIACQHGQDAIVASLLEAGADASHVLPGGVTMLMLAARTGKPDPVRRLLERGVDVEAGEREGQTALMWAAAEGNVEAVDLLVEADARLDRALDSGMTAMMFAVREGHTEVVQRLLDAGVDVHAAIEPADQPRGRDPRRGMSALMFAVENAHFEMAAMLIDRGADPNDQRSGYAPLHALSWVRKANRGEGVDGDPEPRGSGNLTSLQFVRFLVDQGADVNLQLERGSAGKAKLNPRGATPFLLASKTADLPYLQLLLELGADPLIPNADGCTPIMAAAGIGVTAVGEEAGTEPEVLETVAFLADLGADLNTVDDNGETVLHGAAYRSYPRVATLLYKLGADPRVWHRKNRHGWTPHRIAQGYRPGSFKPSPEMIAAIEAAMLDAGLDLPSADEKQEPEQVDRWADKKPKPDDRWQDGGKKVPEASSAAEPEPEPEPAKSSGSSEPARTEGESR